jgi:hypothetical protein
MMHRRTVVSGKQNSSQAVDYDSNTTDRKDSSNRKRGRHPLMSIPILMVGILSISILVISGISLLNNKRQSPQPGGTPLEHVVAEAKSQQQLPPQKLRREQQSPEEEEGELSKIDNENEAIVPGEPDEQIPLHPPVQQQQQQNAHGDSTKEPQYHIIFSTGCSIYQDWQSYIFYYFAMKSKQPGIVTRIVSGCEPEDEAKLQQFFDETIHPMSPEGRFRIHFTPDYAHIKGKYFPYFNKRTYYTYSLFTITVFCPVI